MCLCLHKPQSRQEDVCVDAELKKGQQEMIAGTGLVLPRGRGRLGWRREPRQHRGSHIRDTCFVTTPTPACLTRLCASILWSCQQKNKQHPREGIRRILEKNYHSNQNTLENGRPGLGGKCHIVLKIRAQPPRDVSELRGSELAGAPHTPWASPPVWARGRTGVTCQRITPATTSRCLPKI